MACLLAGMACVAARAAASEQAADRGTYSTGASGARHKWLPYRDPRTVRDAQVLQASHNEPLLIPASPVVQTSGNAFSDPFDDPRPATRTAGAVRVAETVSEGMPNENALQFPGATAESTTVQASPERASPERASPVQASPVQLPQGGPAPILPRENGARQVQPKNNIEEELPPGVAKKEKIRCPSIDELKHIDKVSVNIRVTSKGYLPDECPLDTRGFTPRSFAPLTYTWTASALCHKPLYFEDIQVERYGHNLGPIVQPFVSAGRFFVEIPLLPYNMGLEPPGECIYTLGYYRPGSCAPYMLDPFPLSVRAGLFEAGAATGLVFLLP